MKSQVYLQWTKINGSFVNWDVFCECLFVSQFWEFSSHSRNFHSYGDVTITGEGLHILTCARTSWPLSSEGSLAYHTYCERGHLFTMVISEEPWHSHREFCSGAVTNLLNNLGSLSYISKFRYPCRGPRAIAGSRAFKGNRAFKNRIKS